MRLADAASFLSYFRLGDAATRRLAAPFESPTDDRTIVGYSILFYIGSGFGFYVNFYRLGPDGYQPNSLIWAKIHEYLQWSDPITPLLSRPEDAARIEEIRTRQRIASTPPAKTK